jgi:hypothetical protein
LRRADAVDGVGSWAWREWRVERRLGVEAGEGMEKVERAGRDGRQERRSRPKGEGKKVQGFRNSLKYSDVVVLDRYVGRKVINHSSNIA